jgi:hypothetical protein
MAQDNMLYLAIAVGMGVVLLTDNPVKDALTTAVPSLKTSLASLQTSINSIITPGDTSGTPADNPATPAATAQGKHKRGHGRNRHSNFAYQDCGY